MLSQYLLFILLARKKEITLRTDHVVFQTWWWPSVFPTYTHWCINWFMVYVYFIYQDVIQSIYYLLLVRLMCILYCIYICILYSICYVRYIQYTIHRWCMHWFRRSLSVISAWIENAVRPDLSVLFLVLTLSLRTKNIVVVVIIVYYLSAVLDGSVLYPVLLLVIFRSRWHGGNIHGCFWCLIAGTEQSSGWYWHYCSFHVKGGGHTATTTQWQTGQATIWP